MTRFDEERVRRVAALARLPLTREEEAQFARELADVCAAFEGLPADAGDARATDAASAVTAARADEVAPADVEARALILAAFPRRDGRFVKVPRGL